MYMLPHSNKYEHIIKYVSSKKMDFMTRDAD